MRADKQAKADRIRLEEMKTLPQLRKECQQVFNKCLTSSFAYAIGANLALAVERHTQAQQIVLMLGITAV